MTVIAIIPARGGSKGIPGKNIVPLWGRPLVHWTIAAALDSNRARHVVVSTDSEDIADVARDSGADVIMRPESLAHDASPTLPAVLHVLGHYESDIAVLLQPTSPLRTAADISACLDLHLSSGRPVVSVTEAKPWLFTKGEDGSLTPALDIAAQRQLGSFVAPNGAVYVAQTESLHGGRTWWDGPVAYEMPTIRSVDIDTLDDLHLAEWYGRDPLNVSLRKPISQPPDPPRERR